MNIKQDKIAVVNWVFLFWDGIQKGFSFRDSFEKWNFSSKWSSCINKYQERGKIWLVGVCWSVEKIFLLNLQQNHEKWSRKHCQLKRKQTLSDVFIYLFSRLGIPSPFTSPSRDSCIISNITERNIVNNDRAEPLHRSHNKLYIYCKISLYNIFFILWSKDIFVLC